ncbi:hypothetical protein ES703_82703 [subsurface metagenome]
MDWFTFFGNIINRVPFERILIPPRNPQKALEEFAATTTAPVAHKEAPPEKKPTATTQKPQDIATACVPCALGHFSTSAGLLNEAVRFKDEGITSNEILDRVAKVLEEQNTLERVDLTQEKIQSASAWEQEIAELALAQSRELRHSLENFQSIKQLEKAAAGTSTFYRELNRRWFKQRFAHLGPEKAERIAEKVGKLSAEDKDRILKRAETLIEEV